MNVTLDESIAIYARVSLRWFGPDAKKKTRERAEQLTKLGDLEGAKVHRRVGEYILQMERQPASHA